MLIWVMKPVFLILAAVIFAVVLLAALPGTDRTDTDEPVIEANVEAVLEGVSVVASRDGKVLWKLRTDHAVMPSGGLIARLGKVDVEIPSEGLVVKANSGVYDLASSDLRLGNGVEADTGQMVLFSETAILNASTGVVTSSDDVLVKARGFTVKGRGFWARGKEVRIIEQVEAQVE